MDNITNLIEKYSEFVVGSWLKMFNLRKVKIKPINLNIEGFITTIYFSTFNTIRISADKDERVWFGSLIHELYHVYQRQKMGFVKYIFVKTFKRSSLEIPAKVAEIKATEWIGEYKIQKWKEEKQKNERIIKNGNYSK